MPITHNRFDLALREINHERWADFEKIASTFLVSEFPELRTMASPTGDRGRDSELFGNPDLSNIFFQYSVTEFWGKKIRQTVSRLREEFQNVNTLIYLTNQLIGAEADSLKLQLMKEGLLLDIRDRNWFLERRNTDANREHAAEELARIFVDPLLPGAGANLVRPEGLRGDDAKAALLYLEMQIYDGNRSYGLTKAAFDALVRSTLRGTTTEARLTRAQIRQSVLALLPAHTDQQIFPLVDSALLRLSQKDVRHRKDGDEFHYRESEIEKISESASRIELLRLDFLKEIRAEIVAALSTEADVPSSLLDAVQKALETYLMRKGEGFVAAVTGGQVEMDDITLRSIILVLENRDHVFEGKSFASIVERVLRNVITSPTQAVVKFINVLSESYTLFAFLSSTPDVQKVTKKMFSSGHLWLDTSVVLPLFVENTLSDDDRPFAHMFKQSCRAGLRLRISEGVLEEVERHFNRCFAYVYADEWDGEVPYVVSEFIANGGLLDHFRSWSERFFGSVDRLSDLAEFLEEEHGIVLDRNPSCEGISDQVASDVREKWRRAHLARGDDKGRDQGTAFRMADHDSEVLLHVMSERRSQAGRTPFGYSTWWVTLDGKARRIAAETQKEHADLNGPLPVMAVDYLVRYLSFGPNRDKVDSISSSMAKIYAGVALESLPQEFLELARKIRSEHSALPEYLIQRRIRDGLNAERMREGQISYAGLHGARTAIRDVY